MYEKIVIWFLEKYEILRKIWVVFWMAFSSTMLLLVLAFNWWNFGLVAFYFAVIMNFAIFCFIRSMKEYLLNYIGDKKDYIHELLWKIIKRRIGI